MSIKHWGIDIHHTAYLYKTIENQGNIVTASGDKSETEIYEKIPCMGIYYTLVR